MGSVCIFAMLCLRDTADILTSTDDVAKISVVYSRKLI